VTVINKNINAIIVTGCSSYVSAVGVFAPDESVQGGRTSVVNGVPPTQYFAMIPATVNPETNEEQGIFTIQNTVTGNYIRVVDNCRQGDSFYWTTFDYAVPPPPPSQDNRHWFIITRVGNDNNYTFESLGYRGLYLGKVSVPTVGDISGYTALSLTSTATNFTLVS
jgi:hypothetical protein